MELVSNEEYHVTDGVQGLRNHFTQFDSIRPKQRGRHISVITDHWEMCQWTLESFQKI